MNSDLILQRLILFKVILKLPSAVNPENQETYSEYDKDKRDYEENGPPWHTSSCFLFLFDSVKASKSKFLVREVIDDVLALSEGLQASSNELLSHRGVMPDTHVEMTICTLLYHNVGHTQVDESQFINFKIVILV
jgi:hypothetical protein